MPRLRVVPNISDVSVMSVDPGLSHEISEELNQGHPMVGTTAIIAPIEEPLTGIFSIDLPDSLQQRNEQEKIIASLLVQQPEGARIDMRIEAEDYKVQNVWDAMDNSRDKSSRFRAVIKYYSTLPTVIPEEEYDMLAAMKEWSLFSIAPEEEEEENKDTTIQCICSQYINNPYYVRNKINGNILRIGSDCIQKFGSSELVMECQEAERQRLYNMRGSGRFRQCAACRKFRVGVKQPEWRKICNSCYKSGVRVQDDSKQVVGGRECVDCHMAAIPPDKPAYVTRCIGCYRRWKSGELTSGQSSQYRWNSSRNTNPIPPNQRAGDRMCSECGVVTIYSDQPAYIRKCRSCFSLEKKSREDLEIQNAAFSLINERGNMVLQ